MDGIAGGGPEPGAAARVRIEATLPARLSLAEHQNAVPLLRELCVRNDTPQPLREVELRLEASPPFLQGQAWRIDTVAPGGVCRLPEPQISLDGALLGALSEAEPARVTLRLVQPGAADEAAVEIVRADWPVELLPREHWGGLGGRPELVAAFAQPNDPAVERLLKEAAKVLRRHGRDAALDGYRGGARRAWELASALWSAVAALGLDCAQPPAGFEHAGQRVRGPGRIAAGRLATCLDLALLFAAALEQAGLHPLLVFTQGHVLAGVWLRPEEFAHSVVDDITALRKRARLRELLLFETTLLAQRPVPSFSQAIERGEQRIAEAAEAAFELAVDLRRARLQGIRPLAGAPAAVPADAAADAAAPADAAAGFEAAPELPELQEAASEEAAGPPGDRLSRWQRRLLDLSLRNPLLNFRPGKRTLKLEAPEPGALEDLLAHGQALKLRACGPLPLLADEHSATASPEARAQAQALRRTQALDALQRHAVFVELPEEELDARLVELYRGARSALQEGGANTLFLAFGFLSWTRDAKSERRHRAPLILVPVSLDRRSVRSGFTLTLHEDEPRFNPTLLEMLRQDHRLSPGIADGALPRDERGLDIAGLWRTVAAAVKELPGWEVSEDVVLSSFSFAKHLMWKDLTERLGQLRQHPLVRHLIDTPRDPYPDAGPFPDARRLDAELPPEQTFCPLPADSSQLSAVMAAAQGRDFVLIGPPGTGKSQTISNLIAQCLAEGKRVLFVSEKMAALEVVHRRLREAGLGHFCLELHSSKARKSGVMEQLRQAWAAQGSVDAPLWRSEARRLMALRAQLNRYVERLHFRHPNGLNVFEAIGRQAAAPPRPVPALSWPAADAHDAEALQSLRELAGRLDLYRQALGCAPDAHPLAFVAHDDWSHAWQQALLDAAQQQVAAVQRLEAATQRLCGTLGGLGPDPGRQALAALAGLLLRAAGRDWRFALRTDAPQLCAALRQALQRLRRHRELGDALPPPWPQPLQAELRQGLQLLARRRALRAQLSEPWPAPVREALARGLELLQQHSELERQLSARYGAGLGQADVLRLQRDWQEAQQSVWPLGWWRQRGIRAALQVLAEAGSEADVAADLPRLAALRRLQQEIAALDALAAASGGLWAGLRSRPEDLRAALALQAALAAVRLEQPWDDQGLEPVMLGHCGAAMAEELARLRELRRFDEELEALAPLRVPSAGLWAGRDTQPARLEAVLALQAALEAADAGRAWQEDAGLEPVAAGDCGAALAAALQGLRERRVLAAELAAVDALAELSGGTWAGLQSRPEDIEAALAFCAELPAALERLAATPDAARSLKGALEVLLGEGRARLQPDGAVAVAAQEYLDALGAIEPAQRRLAATAGRPPGEEMDGIEAPPDVLLAPAQRLLAAQGRLRDWCAWRRARAQAFALGLAPLVAAVEQGSAAPGSARELFEVAYCRWWLGAVVDGDEVLRGFVSAEHEQRIEDFRALDERFVALTRAWVHASLCAGRPALDGVPRGSEWGLLRHELEKKARHLPLRELLARIPQAVTQLTPCLLMSPLSVAQYLSPETASFDVVVFDEASQIPVWDAIGAIARGRQVVMVGDPKQLPPTSFFDRAEAEPEPGDAEADADLESILDECLGANLPTLHLRWHYRSRCESLIAFSNHRYYGGALVTFPSPRAGAPALSFHAVGDGVYEKGGARTNPAEARALVADLVARLRAPDFAAAGRSIGVVTFNAEQQRLIEDLLDDARRRDPALEAFFDESALEPVFVKNIESVQGDERDIMYFSITYGPGPDGTLSMNFGPMNRSGGERRLNVAITRARRELRVFSSLQPEQMDLSRTRAQGLRDLRHFLEFAQRGPRALAEAVRGSVGGFDSPFEQAVAEALAARGWQVQPQVGVSAFRIDFGVLDPGAPGRYLAGIECDGATYHRSATARDRDKLREQVLRGLGWEIVRIWSTDWWIDPAGTLDRVHARLEALRAASPCKAGNAVEGAGSSGAPAEVAPGAAVASA